MSSIWWVYILRCADATLYTGITTDPSRRLHEHNSNHLGARYTRARRPVEMVYKELSDNRSTASRREYQIKNLSKKDKLLLITQQASESGNQ